MKLILVSALLPVLLVMNVYFVVVGKGTLGTWFAIAITAGCMYAITLMRIEGTRR